MEPGNLSRLGGRAITQRLARIYAARRIGAGNGVMGRYATLTL
ncbi:MAG: hypothetical protein WAL04_04370 [Acidimicrobiales bacterium]